MANFERRLTRLEAALRPEATQPPWGELYQARQRQVARVRLKLGRLLQMDDRHPAVVETMALLVDDDPACQAADEELIARWDRAQGREGRAEATGAGRQRILHRLDLMARRQKEGTTYGTGRDVSRVPESD